VDDGDGALEGAESTSNSRIDQEPDAELHGMDTIEDNDSDIASSSSSKHGWVKEHVSYILRGML
jgi:hypothetical protein